MPIAVTSGKELLRAFDALEIRREYARIELVERRMQRLVASPSGFFRGTPSLFYLLIAQSKSARALMGRDRRWLVGDVHMENIGVIAIGHGKLVYDFNDLDEAVIASASLDVLRGATSAAVSALDLGFGPGAAIRAAEAFIVAYLRPLAEALPRPVAALLARAQKRKSVEMLDERAPLRGGTRRFVLGKRYLPLLDEERPVAEDLFARYARQNPIPWAEKGLRLEDIAFRVQGTGSLGVRRFIFLARAGKRGEQVLLEAKEMRESALVRGKLVAHKAVPGGEAARVAEGARALLDAEQVGVRSIVGKDKRSYLMRLHAPGEDKLILASLRDETELVALARMIAFRLSQAHERAAGRPPPALDAGEMLSLALDMAHAVARAHMALKVRVNAMTGA